MNRTNRCSRAGFSLVEVIAVTAMMAVVATSSFGLVRTANDAWRRHRDDGERRRQATAVLQHVVRRVRQATAVASISAAADLSGYLTLAAPNGMLIAWDHDAGANRVLYGSPAANAPLGEGVTSMVFVGYAANGVTVATDPAKIHSVYCRVGYSLPRPAGATTEYVSCMAWLRSW